MLKTTTPIKTGNHQAELTLFHKPINVFEDRKYSKWLAAKADMEPEDFTEAKFFHLRLLPEEYCYAE
ncbi:unnamed protein product [Gongylonema pulchrum]|uniref:Phage protein n=1 Tax=Gongylonema pulchrum TaxID=637853 RepID=A0A183E5H1_9BILA|nr:unnamed protein product [Gongylonema pulchrum]VDN27454.1 unnamed protein product [Gongylonema pulchrum]